MFPTSSTLGIAEGIETALACHQITKCNTRATMNTAFMKKFRVPAGVKNLIILQTQMQTLLGMPPLLNALRRICTRRMIWKVSPCAGLRRVILMICCLTVQKYSSGYFTGDETVKKPAAAKVKTYKPKKCASCGETFTPARNLQRFVARSVL